MNGELTKSVPVTDRHNQSSLGAESETQSQLPASRRQWPITFPRIKDHYKPINPTVNEPIILRYSAKALFNTDCENLTFGKYKHFDQAPKQKRGGLMKSPTQATLLPKIGRFQAENSKSLLTQPANQQKIMKVESAQLPRIHSKKGNHQTLAISSSGTASTDMNQQGSQLPTQSSPKQVRDFTAEDNRKKAVLEDGRRRLFTRFPEIKTVFARQHVPTNYLRESVEYECL